MTEDTPQANTTEITTVVDDSPVEISPLEEAKKLKEENIKLLAEMRKEREKIEKAAAELLVGGRSFAGQTKPKELSEDEKWAADAKIRYEGTGYDPT